MQLKSTIKNSLTDLVIDSTSHGLPKIFKSKHFPMKLIWTVCFIVSSCYCSYTVFQVVCDYLSYDVVTVFETVYETPAKFPVITICNTNSFQTQQSEKIVEDFFSKFKFDSSVPSSIKKYFLMNEIFDKNDTIKRSISYQLEESLIGCEFNMIKCNAIDFEWTFHPNYGNCYRFNNNPKDSKEISNYGILYGLKLELFVDPPIDCQDLVKNNGYHIIINNQTEDPRYIFGFDVSVGMESNIVINRYYDYHLDEPYNECKNDLNTLDAYDSDLYRSIINSNLSYHQMDCFYLCYQKKVINKCKCYLKTHNKLSNDPPCSDSTQISCSQEVWYEFLQINFFKNCSEDCPSKCDTVSYTWTSSASDYPSKPYFNSYLINNSIIKSKFINQSITYEDLKSKILALDIYYDRMSYTKTTQQPKTTIFDLVSNMGGLLGLFIGISFLSVVEIFEALFEVVYIVCFSGTKVQNIT